MEGFFNIHRQIFDSWVFADDKALKIWIWLIGKARHKDGVIPLKHGKGTTTIKLKKGQLLFGRHKAEDVLCYDGSLIYRKLKKFEEDEMIKIESNNLCSIITICNYEDYQEDKDSKRTSNAQVSNNHRTTGEQLANSERTTNEQLANTNNNVNNVNNVNNENNDNNDNKNGKAFILISQEKVFDPIQYLKTHKGSEFEALKMNKDLKDWRVHEIFDKVKGESFTTGTHFLNKIKKEIEPKQQYYEKQPERIGRDIKKFDYKNVRLKKDVERERNNLNKQ